MHFYHHDHHHTTRRWDPYHNDELDHRLAVTDVLAEAESEQRGLCRHGRRRQFGLGFSRALPAAW
jgi:hypothetical protein